jgi:hypothetical protein
MGCCVYVRFCEHLHEVTLHMSAWLVVQWNADSVLCCAARHGVTVRDSEWNAGMILSRASPYYLQAYDTNVNYAQALGAGL